MIDALRAMNTIQAAEVVVPDGLVWIECPCGAHLDLDASRPTIQQLMTTVAQHVAELPDQHADL